MKIEMIVPIPFPLFCSSTNSHQSSIQLDYIYILKAFILFVCVFYLLAEIYYFAIYISFLYFLLY